MASHTPPGASATGASLPFARVFFPGCLRRAALRLYCVRLARQCSSSKPRVHRFQNHRNLRVELAPASGLELPVNHREASMTQRGFNLPADCPFQDDVDNFLRHVSNSHNARVHFRAVMEHFQIVGTIAMTGAPGIMTSVQIATVTMTTHAMPKRTNNTCEAATRCALGNRWQPTAAPRGWTPTGRLCSARAAALDAHAPLLLH